MRQRQLRVVLDEFYVRPRIVIAYVSQGFERLNAIDLVIDLVIDRRTKASLAIFAGCSTRRCIEAGKPEYSRSLVVFYRYLPHAEVSVARLRHDHADAIRNCFDSVRIWLHAAVFRFNLFRPPTNCHRSLDVLLTQ